MLLEFCLSRISSMDFSKKNTPRVSFECFRDFFENFSKSWSTQSCMWCLKYSFYFLFMIFFWNLKIPSDISPRVPPAKDFLSNLFRKYFQYSYRKSSADFFKNFIKTFKKCYLPWTLWEILPGSPLETSLNFLEKSIHRSLEEILQWLL